MNWTALVDKAATLTKRKPPPRYLGRGAGEAIDFTYQDFSFRQYVKRDGTHVAEVERSLFVPYPFQAGSASTRVAQSLYSTLLEDGVLCSIDGSRISSGKADTRFEIDVHGIARGFSEDEFVLQAQIKGKYIGNPEETYYKLLRTLFEPRAAAGYKDPESAIKRLFSFE